MSSLIVGSTAAAYHFPDFKWEVKDFDTFGSTPPAGADNFWAPELEGSQLDRDGYATPDELYTILISHAPWELPNGSWNKHLARAMWLKRKGTKLIPELHDLLYPIWVRQHGSKKVDLTKERDEFFKDAVVRKYDHDSVHRSVAYTPGKPLYEQFLKPGHSIDMDMAAIWDSSEEVQVKLFREEIMATALERIVIPRNYKVSPGFAYHWALRRTITSLCRGRSARFIAERYDTFVNYDREYVQRHLAGKRFLIPL